MGFSLIVLRGFLFFIIITGTSSPAVTIVDDRSLVEWLRVFGISPGRMKGVGWMLDPLEYLSSANAEFLRIGALPAIDLLMLELTVLSSSKFVVASGAKSSRPRFPYVNSFHLSRVYV